MSEVRGLAAADDQAVGTPKSGDLMPIFRSSRGRSSRSRSHRRPSSTASLVRTDKSGAGRHPGRASAVKATSQDVSGIAAPSNLTWVDSRRSAHERVERGHGCIAPNDSQTVAALMLRPVEACATRTWRRYRASLMPILPVASGRALVQHWRLPEIAVGATVDHASAACASDDAETKISRLCSGTPSAAIRDSEGRPEQQDADRLVQRTS